MKNIHTTKSRKEKRRFVATGVERLDRTVIAGIGAGRVNSTVIELLLRKE